MPKTLDERIADVEQETVERIARIRKATNGKIAQMREREKAKREANDRIGALRLKLEADYAMESHPKRELVWSKAWEHGHATGFADVEFWYSELVELVK